jgi:hypothetical protein
MSEVFCKMENTGIVEKKFRTQVSEYWTEKGNILPRLG